MKKNLINKDLVKQELQAMSETEAAEIKGGASDNSSLKFEYMAMQP